VNAPDPTPLDLLAPLEGWSTPLEEAPDEVFATRMLGDGVAIDPTAGTLYAPCEGELVSVAPSRHAVTLRAPGGCEILLHVGIDTVGLKGEGFQVHAEPGSLVRPGDALLSFDLDLLARRARSLLTPVIITAERGFRIERRTLGHSVAVGDFLMRVTAAAAVSADGGAVPAPAAQRLLTRRLPVALVHGIHARPAALLAAALRTAAADVRLAAHGKEVNARSTVALMALGVRHGDQVEIRASGPDAARVIEALAALLAPPMEDVPSRRVGGSAPSAAAAAAPSVAPRAQSGGGTLPGVIASRGLAVGPAVQMRRPEVAVAQSGADAAAEYAALERARSMVRARLERASRAPAEPGTEAAREIAAAHLELLEDPELLAGARALMREGKSAGFAWRATLRAAAQELRQLPDARLRERADDLLDLEIQVLLELHGAAPAAIQLPPQAIVIARELLPSQLVALDDARLGGLALAAGGATSHVAIIAAARGIPALVALGPDVLSVADGTALVLDAERGALEVTPSPARLMVARAEVAAHRTRLAAAQAAAQRECRTADGTRIEVFANVGSVAEARAAVANGAEGCGLLRTEFLFLDRDTAPSEAEQASVYQAIADVLAPRPLTIRTLDAGGDKPIAYLPLPAEENPALGLRGVRTGLSYPQLLRGQLRAMLAVRPRERCRVLLPMITDVAELKAVRALLEELRRESGGGPVPLGVMIETPASALIAGQLAPSADFFSIGTNDLTQYTLAMDRGNPRLAPRLDAVHPAVLRLIAATTEAARPHGRYVAVCGGLASDPDAAALLVGLGVHELSAVPAVIPQLKERLGAVALTACRELAAEALRRDSAAAVRELLARAAPAAGEGAQ
jgi:phosphocarrier protein FPr/phosphocarrier protein